MKYVKIKGHNNWFLVLKKGNKVPEGLSETMQKRMLRKVWHGVHGNGEPNYSDRAIIKACEEIDYERILELGPLDMLVRPFGSYMFLAKDVKVTRVKYSEDFPTDNFGTIIICENDDKANYKWEKYLAKRFPEETVEVINFFDTQSDTKIKEYFKHAKHVTFSTTFSSLVWWHKLVKNLYKNNKVIGYCHEKRNWKEALKIYSNVEVVKAI